MLSMIIEKHIYTWYNIQIGIVNKSCSWLGSLTASCFVCISTDSISMKIANKDRSLVASDILCWSCLEGNFANCGSRIWPHTIETRIYAHKCTQGHAITQRHIFLYFWSYYYCCCCRASWIYMWLGIHPAVVRLSKVMLPTSTMFNVQLRIYKVSMIILYNRILYIYLYLYIRII